VARLSTRVPSTLAHTRAYLKLPERMGVKKAREPSGLRALSSAPNPVPTLPLHPYFAERREPNPALSPILAARATQEPHPTAQHRAAARYLAFGPTQASSPTRYEWFLSRSGSQSGSGFFPRAELLPSFPTVSLFSLPPISVPSSRWSIKNFQIRNRSFQKASSSVPSSQRESLFPASGSYGFPSPAQIRPGRGGG
jgi:hypothetical protein